MSLRDYEYIKAVAELGHFGLAAKRCHVSQPTLSMQIKKFEDRHQIQLFERDNKNVHLTKEGQVVIKQIETVLQAQSELINTVNHLKNPNSGEYILGAFPTLAPFFLPQIMPSLVKDFPKIKFFFSEERSPDLIEQLSEHKLDAIFLALPLENETKFEYVPLFTEEFFVALPKGHPLSSAKTINLKDLKNETLMLLEDSHCLSGQALEACQWAGLKRTHDFRATSIETLRQMVANGLGVTLVPKMAIRKDDPGIIYKPLDKTSKAGRTIGLVWRKGYPHTDLMQRFATIIQNVYRK